MLISAAAAATDPIYDILELAHWFLCSCFFFAVAVRLTYDSSAREEATMSFFFFFFFFWFRCCDCFPGNLSNSHSPRYSKSFVVFLFSRLFFRVLFFAWSLDNLFVSDEHGGALACVRVPLWHNAAAKAIKFFFSSNKNYFDGFLLSLNLRTRLTMSVWFGHAHA